MGEAGRVWDPRPLTVGEGCSSSWRGGASERVAGVDGDQCSSL